MSEKKLSYVNSVINFYKKKPFIHNVITVGSGQITAQVIVLAFSPIITRLYGPEPYGVLGVFLATNALVNTIGSLTYHIAIVLPKEDKQAKAIALLSVYILILVAGLLMFLLVIFKESIISLLQIQSISAYIYLIPVFIIFSGLNKISEQWIIRKEKFKIIAKVKIFKSLIINSTKTGIGFYSPIALVLILVSTIGEFLHALMLSWSEFKMKNLNINNLKSAIFLDFHTIKKVAKIYYDFPLYRAPQAFIASITINTPILILTGFFGPVAAGFYTIAHKAIKKPISFISSSIGKVFYPRVAKALNNGENIYPLLLKATLGLSAIGVIPFGIIILFGPPLFGFVFGSEWVVAGEYARWMSVWLYFEFVKTAPVQAIPVLGFQGFFLVYTVISTPISIGVLVLSAIFTEHAVQSLALFCIVSGLFSALLIFIVLHKSK